MDSARLSRLYGAGAAGAQAARYGRLQKLYEEHFGKAANLRYISAPGRTEIAGNHTDHNAGCVLAAAINLDALALAAPNGTSVVSIYDEGYSALLTVDVSDLTIHEEEKGVSLSLIRGVAARMAELGFRVGGFNACVTSTVLKGSGLSSSAAFEVLICAVFDSLFGGFAMDAKLRAQIAQYAENVYFGKPCGLMDQTASSVGGLVAIDFGGTGPSGGAVPIVTAMTYDFEAKGYGVAVVSAGGEHGNLTHEYAAIPAEMKSVAALFGKKAMREVDPKALEEGIARIKGKVSDRAILRALHFADENARVGKLVEALKADDLSAFFRLIIESGESSWKLLQNIYVPGGGNQEMALALEISRRMLEGKGAWRIHGGGFAGTILAFVPLDMMDEYARRMNAVFGEKAVVRLMIRPEGAIEFKS